MLRVVTVVLHSLVVHGSVAQASPGMATEEGVKHKARCFDIR